MSRPSHHQGFGLRKGISPVYIRYFATGSVTLNLPGQEPVTESGDMIYEYPITGNPDPRAGV